MTASHRQAKFDLEESSSSHAQQNKDTGLSIEYFDDVVRQTLLKLSQGDGESQHDDSDEMKEPQNPPQQFSDANRRIAPHRRIETDEEDSVLSDDSRDNSTFLPPQSRASQRQLKLSSGDKSSETVPADKLLGKDREESDPDTRVSSPHQSKQHYYTRKITMKDLRGSIHQQPRSTSSNGAPPESQIQPSSGGGTVYLFNQESDTQKDTNKREEPKRKDEGLVIEPIIEVGQAPLLDLATMSKQRTKTSPLHEDDELEEILPPGSLRGKLKEAQKKDTKKRQSQRVVELLDRHEDSFSDENSDDAGKRNDILDAIKTSTSAENTRKQNDPNPRGGQATMSRTELLKHSQYISQSMRQLGIHSSGDKGDDDIIGEVARHLGVPRASMMGSSSRHGSRRKDSSRPSSSRPTLSKSQSLSRIPSRGGGKRRMLKDQNENALVESDEVIDLRASFEKPSSSGSITRVNSAGSLTRKRSNEDLMRSRSHELSHHSPREGRGRRRDGTRSREQSPRRPESMRDLRRRQSQSSHGRSRSSSRERLGSSSHRTSRRAVKRGDHDHSASNDRSFPNQSFQGRSSRDMLKQQSFRNRGSSRNILSSSDHRKSRQSRNEATFNTGGSGSRSSRRTLKTERDRENDRSRDSRTKETPRRRSSSANARRSSRAQHETTRRQRKVPQNGNDDVMHSSMPDVSPGTSEEGELTDVLPAQQDESVADQSKSGLKAHTSDSSISIKKPGPRRRESIFAVRARTHEIVKAGTVLFQALVRGYLTRQRIEKQLSSSFFVLDMDDAKSTKKVRRSRSKKRRKSTSKRTSKSRSKSRSQSKGKKQKKRSKSASKRKPKIKPFKAKDESKLSFFEQKVRAAAATKIQAFYRAKKAWATYARKRPILRDYRNFINEKRVAKELQATKLELIQTKIDISNDYTEREIEKMRKEFESHKEAIAKHLKEKIDAEIMEKESSSDEEPQPLGLTKEEEEEKRHLEAENEALLYELNELSSSIQALKKETSGLEASNSTMHESFQDLNANAKKESKEKTKLLMIAARFQKVSLPKAKEQLTSADLALKMEVAQKLTFKRLLYRLVDRVKEASEGDAELHLSLQSTLTAVEKKIKTESDLRAKQVRLIGTSQLVGTTDPTQTPKKAPSGFALLASQLLAAKEKELGSKSDGEAHPAGSTGKSGFALLTEKLKQKEKEGLGGSSAALSAATKKDNPTPTSSGKKSGFALIAQTLKEQKEQEGTSDPDAGTASSDTKKTGFALLAQKMKDQKEAGKSSLSLSNTEGSKDTGASSTAKSGFSEIAQRLKDQQQKNVISEETREMPATHMTINNNQASLQSLTTGNDTVPSITKSPAQYPKGDKPLNISPRVNEGGLVGGSRGPAEQYSARPNDEDESDGAAGMTLKTGSSSDLNGSANLLSDAAESLGSQSDHSLDVGLPQPRKAAPSTIANESFHMSMGSVGNMSLGSLGNMSIGSIGSLTESQVFAGGNESFKMSPVNSFRTVDEEELFTPPAKPKRRVLVDEDDEIGPQAPKRPPIRSTKVSNDQAHYVNGSVPNSADMANSNSFSQLQNKGSTTKDGQNGDNDVIKPLLEASRKSIIIDDINKNKEYYKWLVQSQAATGKWDIDEDDESESVSNESEGSDFSVELNDG